MCPVVGEMFLVVAGTILAPESLTRTLTSGPETTWPFVGETTSSLAGLLGRADGVVVEEGSPQQMFSAPKNDRTRQFLQSILERNAELGDEAAPVSSQPRS